MKTAIAALFLSLAAQSCLAADQEKASPLETYRVDSQLALMLCSAQAGAQFARAELIAVGGTPQGESTADYVACVAQQRASTRASFDKAMRTLKKASAREALKSCHVALLTALDGIAPATDERKVTYSQRQAALAGRLSEAWARFEVEQ